jgi:hypothetical protein
MGLEYVPKLRKSGPRTTRLRSQSRPLVQLSNGYPNMISYLEMKNLGFQHRVPLRFKHGPRICPEVEKKWPKNYTSSLAIKTTCTNLKSVSKYDFIFGNEEFFFSTHISTSFETWEEYVPMSRKSGPRTTHLRSQSRPHVQLSNGYPNMISFLEMENFDFQPIVPLRFKHGLRICLEVEKKRPKNYTSSLAIKTTCTTLKWVSKYDFIFRNGEF